MFRPSQDDLLALHAEACVLAACAFGVNLKALLSAKTTKARIARHVAVYLVRMQGLATTSIASLFEQSRAAVYYACNAVEKARDDPALDAQLDALEISLRRRLRSIGRPTHYAVEVPNRAE